MRPELMNMHSMFEFLMGAYLQVLTWVVQLASALAVIANRPVNHGDYALAAVIAASILLGLLCCIWAVAERVRGATRRGAMRAALARAQADIRFRETMIAACPEAIAVIGGDLGKPLSYRGGAALLQACLDGPDAATLAAKLESLITAGAAFTLSLRTASCPVVAVRGCSVGSRAAVFFRVDKDAPEPEADFCATMDALPIPVWIRNKHMVLTWANRAFLAATASSTLRDALLKDASLDQSERDLARAASDGADKVSTKRYVVINGQRRALTIDMRRLPDKSVAGFATDVTDITKAEAKLQLSADAFSSVLNTFDTAIAIFGADRRLETYNGAYVRMWRLPEQWLDAHPTFDDILDRLREMRRLPEQRDFGAWKRELMEQFEQAGHHHEATWHSPTGLSVDVKSYPYLLGGAIYVFRDISERLRLEASYQMLVRSQRATLNTISDAMAMFGPDDRLKLYNDAFVRLWKLTENQLSDQPHLTKVADLCASRTGRDGIWSMVSAGVNSSEPARYGEWGHLARADGRSLSLALTRLPEGATLVTFADVTDLQRFQTLLREEKQSSVA
jgi:PAS domain-containing protein